MTLYIIIAVIIFIGCIYLHNSANKYERTFMNRPSIINNPAKDLLINEKYAIVRLIAFVQGANLTSAYSDEASRIAQSTIFELGLSQKEFVKVLKVSMAQNAERQINQIISSLDEIKDRDYLYRLYRRCSEIAEISCDDETIEVVEHIFKELHII